MPGFIFLENYLKENPFFIPGPRLYLNRNVEKLFGTDGIRGEVGKFPLTREAVFAIGRSIGIRLKEQFPQEKSALKIVVGKDTRQSGAELESALLKGANREGLKALRIGVCPTPTVAYLTCALSAHLGLAISASHNPGSDNGIKFFNAKGFKLFPSAESCLEQIFFNLYGESKKPDLQSEQTKKEHDYTSLYMDFAKSALGKLRLKNLRVVIDCAFGSFSKIAPQALQELGADVFPINNQPDGKNINVNCGTLHPQSMARKILEHQADIGLAFDGDGDRVIVADERGNVLDGDHILAILGRHLFEQKRLKQNTIVCTQMSNIGLELYLEGLGIKTIRTDVGDKYVLEEMLRRRTNLGGEQSGHIIFLERTTTGDGLIVALELIKVMKQKKKNLSALAVDLKKSPQVLVNVKVKEKKPIEKIRGLQAAVCRCQSQLGKTGRVFIRYSGTEDLARIMIEGRQTSLINRLSEGLAKIIKEEVGQA